jgi:hypothetical protein
MRSKSCTVVSRKAECGAKLDTQITRINIDSILAAWAATLADFASLNTKYRSRTMEADKR